MPNVGTITGSMYLDPSAYISGLNQAAGATRQFQQGVTSISFAGFNRGIFATTTLLYGLERIMSGMSKSMEEYANMLGRIGTVADLTAASVAALADSMKQVSVYYGVSRTDVMGGMYTASQAGYSTPAEMRAMATSGARLSRASGKEIDVRKSVDLQSGIRQALGIGMDAVSSNRMNDILLKGRDIGRWELNEMAHALGIPLTVWGNQFAGKQSGEETLRQLLAVMSVASLSGVTPNMTATGTKRIVEKTVQLASSGKRADPLRNALRGAGFGGEEPILEALNQGGLRYLNTLMGITGGGQTSELTRMGYGARDLLVLTSALRGKGEKLNAAYQEMGYGNIAGTTDRYTEKMRQTYDYQRDRLRSEWLITSQEFMQATVPLINQFTNMLEGLNKVAQSLPESVKSFMLFMGAMVAMRLALNFAGFRSNTVMPKLGAAGGLAGLGGAAGGTVSRVSGSIAAGTVSDPAAARVMRNLQRAKGRASSWGAGFGGPSSTWVSPVGAPWGTDFKAFKPMMWNEVPQLARGSGTGFGPYWYNSPRQEPLNFVQDWNMRAFYEKNEKARLASNSVYWDSVGNRLPYMRTTDRAPSQLRQIQLMNTAALGNHFLPGQISGAQYSGQTGYGPSAEARIRWEAYKRGQSVDFASGTYGTLSPGAQSYFANRGKGPYSASAAEWAGRGSAAQAYGQAALGPMRALNANIIGQMNSGDNTPGLLRQIGRYSSASKIFAESGIKPTSSAWRGMGVGASAQALGFASGNLMKFGTSLADVIGPLLKFGAVMGALGKLIEGLTYKGRGGDDVKLGGRSTWEKKGGDPTLLDAIGQGYKAAGAWVSGGPDLLGEAQEDYAEAHGFTTEEDPKKIKSNLWKKGIGLYLATNPMTALAGIPLLSWFNKKNPIGLEGYRRSGMDDVMGKLSRENLSSWQVQKMRAGGIDFDNFASAKPYVERYMKEQLNKNVPDNWDEWIRGDQVGRTQIVEDALKFYGEDILKKGVYQKGPNDKVMTSRNGTKYVRQGGSYKLVSKPGEKPVQTPTDIDNVWKRDISPDTIDQVVRSRILAGKQWDIYSGADYAGANERMNWNAGGKDYRAMYATELGNLDKRFGGFTDQSYSANARASIKSQEAAWSAKKKAVTGREFSGFPENQGLEFMLAEGDKDFSKMQMIRKLLGRLPDLKSMPEDEARKLFMEATGRDDMTDVFAKANFDNFRNMNVGDYVSVQQKAPPLQYAQATQFGTAEAYNQLLARPDSGEKMLVAVDKFVKTIDDMRVTKEQVETELQAAIKGAVKFFGQEGIEKLGFNIEAMAGEMADG